MSSDVLIFRSNRGRFADQTLVNGDGGEICSGPLKIAQRWLIEFCTESGTIPYRTRGCDFMRLARSGAFRTEMDVFQGFLLSEVAIRQILLNEETGLEPTNERYDGSTLEKIVLNQGGLSLLVKVTNVAGQSLKLLLPIELKL